MLPNSLNNKPVILFDGVCNFCNNSVQFVMKNDKHSKFLFASLQSQFGESQLHKYNIDPSKTDSIVLIQHNKAYVKSAAALHIAKQLNGVWPVLFVFMLVPAFIRNGVYDFIAKNRYRWFGKTDACRLPTAEERARFIDV